MVNIILFNFPFSVVNFSKNSNEMDSKNSYDRLKEAKVDAFPIILQIH